MRIAVLSLTRDRLDYSQHCFASLIAYAGCAFDHYVYDQGSKDSTQDWLANVYSSRYPARIYLGAENVGIHRGHNALLEMAGNSDYDFYVTFDNDCEVTTPDTLKVACETAGDDWILSPTVNGLLHPPQARTEMVVRGQRVGLYPALGGIFRVMPARFVREFRFDETRPYWGNDEMDVGAAAIARGFGMGYLLDWTINHYETTAGQQVRFPGYFDRKFAEMT